MKKSLVPVVLALLCSVVTPAKTLIDRMNTFSARLNELTAAGQVFSNETTHLLDALADDFAAAEEYSSAEQAVKTSAFIRERIFGKESLDYAYSLCRIAGMHLHYEHTDSARMALDEAGRIFAAHRDVDAAGYRAYYASARATMAYLSGDLDTALRLVGETVRLFRTDTYTYARYLSQWLAMELNMLMERGEIPADYRSRFDEIERILDARGDLDNSVYGDVLYIKAAIELRMRRPEVALKDIEKAIAITDSNFENVNMRHVNQRLLKINIMQLTLQPTEGIKEADAMMDFLISSRAESRFPQQIAALRGYKARMLCDLGNHADAIFYADRVLASEAVEDYRRAAQLTRAMALHKAGRFEEAEAEAGDCYRALEGRIGVFAEYRFLAALSMAQSVGASDVERGLQCVDEVRAAMSRESAAMRSTPGFINIAWELEHLRGKLLLNRFLRSGDRFDFSRAEQALREADRGLRQSMSYADRTNVADKYLSALYAGAGRWDETMESLGRLSKTLRDSEGVVGFLSSTERQAFAAELLGFPYRVIAETALKSGRDDAVEMFADHTVLGKSLLLETERQLDEIGATLISEEAKRLYADYRSVSDYAFAVAAGGEGAATARDARRKAERLLLEHPEVITALKQSAPGYREVQRKLRTGEVLVEFVETASVRDNGDSPVHMALVIRPEGKPALVPLAPMPRFDEDNLKDIYSWLWRPLEKALSGVRRVYFSPSGMLHTLPVECFTGDSGREYRRISSARELLRQSPEGAFGNREMALFGGITYDGGFRLGFGGSKPREEETLRGFDTFRAGIAPLDGASREVDAIGRLMAPQFTVRKYKGDGGSESRLRALSGKAPELLHIATHGFYYAPDAKAQAARGLRRMFAFTGEQPDCEKAMYRSGLFLSGANLKLRGQIAADANLLDDGIVTARELADLDLRGVRLCVLSACRSGLGEVNSEGIFGLPRALKRAGVQSTLMSLWNVDDRATELFMREFYSRLRDGHSLTASVEGARKYLRGIPEYNHPRYWSAFILMDDVADEI